MKGETAILIWLPSGDVPQEPAFSATGASTFLSLQDALTVAAKSTDRPGQPWISTADAIYSPEQIQIMTQDSGEDD
jgi:hypothetical protein